MSRIQVTWVIKNRAGQVKGPYSTEAILRMISEGVFSGDEMISKLPDGQWSLISKEPEFYDKLLEALEGVVSVDPEKAKRMEAETQIIPLEPKFIPTEVNPPEPPPINLDELKIKPESNTKLAQTKPINAGEYVAPLTPRQNKGQKNKKGGKQKEKVIELSNIPKVETGKLLATLKMPMAVLVTVLVVGYLLLSDGGVSKVNKIHLIAPSKTASPLTEVQIKTKLNEALFAIEQDNFDSYLQAENALVNMVEGSTMNIEVRALLCMVYRELWPFAYQDAQDSKTISAMTQATKALNVISPLGQVCEAVKLLTGGRFREARSAIESTLETSQMFSLLPVFYTYKAELLWADRDYLNAIPYFEKSIQLWDKWLHPQIQLAHLQYEKQSYSDASNVLQGVLKKSPKNKEAQYLLGVVEYRGFKNTDAAFRLLTSAYESKVRIPMNIEALGLHALAEIYAYRDEKNKALILAQKAFDLNSNNGELRQLVIRLGGSDKVKSTRSQNNELLFMGDQYVRQGDYLAAQAEFKAAFEADSKNGTAAMKAAKALWQLNQSFEAIDWLGKAVKAEPQLVSAYVLQSDYMSQRFDFAGATLALMNVSKIAPNNYEVLRGFAWLEFRKNNMVGAVNYATRGMKVYDGDIETYILLAKANGILAQSIVPLNKKEIERKESAARDATRYATKAVEIDATNPEAQITYAKTIASANGVDSGITYLNELIKRYSYNLEYQLALAEIYKSEDRWNQAHSVYEKVTSLDPRNKRAWLGLGESSKALGVNEKALKEFLQAAILDPTDGEALFQAGKVYLETNRFDEAIQQFKRVQRLNPHFPRTNYFIGKAAFAAGDFNTAMEAAKAEKKLNPNIADSYILVAEIHAARKQFQDCAGEYSLAMKLRTQGAEIYVKAAQCYRKSGSVDVAEDMLSLASSRESGYADIYKELGAIYELKGDARSAATAYNKYLGLSPNALDRAEISARIMRLGQ